MSKKNPIAFKGTSNGLFLNIDDDVLFEEIPKCMTSLLEKSKQFYKGGTIIGLVGKKLSYKEKAIIETLLVDSFDLKVESLETPEKSTPKKLQNESLEPEIKEVIVEKIVVKEVPVIVEEKMPIQPSNRAHYVFGTLRSGKSIEFAGDIVVIGDVNPGAVIVAEGNIFVMGRVMGFVHAGSAGDEKAFVVANALKPTQIRIAKYISVPPSEDFANHIHGIEKAYVGDGIIKIETIH